MFTHLGLVAVPVPFLGIAYVYAPLLVFVRLCNPLQPRGMK
ncbi:hypothetical protein [Paracoccus sp. MKU1]|nr:hypothetical protein [Paracoccus sp. MKU1]